MMEQIKELREKTGAGMVDCKKALEEASGNIEVAIEILRKKGIAKAAKREDRETSEGVVVVGVNDVNDKGYILEVNSETDFVARNEQFQQLANKVFDIIKTKEPAGLDELLAMDLDGNTVKDQFDSMSGVIGEKLGVKKFEILSGASVAAYSHMGGRIGVLVALDQAEKTELAQDIAMQVAAANPKYLNTEDVPADEVEKEKDIYREQLKKEGKPEEMIEKILVGKVNKYFEEVCLVKQEYIKEDKKKVNDILDGVKIEKFIRYSL